MSLLEEAIAAVRAGALVLIPTDTVYGLACAGEREDAVGALSRVKQRASAQPIALLAARIDPIVEVVPELAGRSEAIMRALLPGPFTLVLPNPARRLPWLAGRRPDTIGVRVPRLGGDARSIVEAVGAVAATSANLHGGPDPRSLVDVPEEIRSAVAAAIDGGELPGVPSTVVDLTGAELRVLREGAVPAAEALARVAEAAAE